MTPIPKEVLEAMVEAGLKHHRGRTFRYGGGFLVMDEHKKSIAEDFLKAALSAAASLGYTLKNGEK